MSCKSANIFHYKPDLSEIHQRTTNSASYHVAMPQNVFKLHVCVTKATSLIVQKLNVIALVRFSLKTNQSFCLNWSNSNWEWKYKRTKIKKEQKSRGKLQLCWVKMWKVPKSWCRPQKWANPHRLYCRNKKVLQRGRNKSVVLCGSFPP